MTTKWQREAESQMKKWKRDTKEGNRFKSWETYHRGKYKKERAHIDPNVNIDDLSYNAFE